MNEPNVREFALREEGQVLSWRRLTNLARFDLIVQPILRQDYIISAFDYSRPWSVPTRPTRARVSGARSRSFSTARKLSAAKLRKSAKRRVNQFAWGHV